MRHTDTQHILLNQDGFCFPVGNDIEKPIKMWRVMTRRSIYSDPKSLNAKNSFIIRRKFNLIR